MTSESVNLLLLLLQLKEDYACSHSITQRPSSVFSLLRASLLDRNWPHGTNQLPQATWLVSCVTLKDFMSTIE